MKNATELRAHLAELFHGVKSGNVEVKTAAELANIAGKMIASAKAQVEYYAIRKEAPKIDFLSDDRG